MSIRRYTEILSKIYVIYAYKSILLSAIVTPSSALIISRLHKLLIGAILSNEIKTLEVYTMFKNTDNNLTTLTRGAFLVAGEGKDANVMTIGWGFFGYMWRKKVFIAPIRSSRFTHEILDKYGYFTVSFPKENDMKKELGFAGSKSGRDVDKFNELSLEKIPAPNSNTYFVGGCEDYIECKIVAKADLTHDMLDGVCDAFYKDNDMHTLYFGEIID